MEGLILAVAELLLLPFIAGITALCELILSLGSFILQVIFGSAAKSAKKKVKISPVVARWIQCVALGSLCFFATALLAINFLFLEETVRFAVDEVEAKTGFEIQYASVEGNLFSGDFAFSGLKLKQTQADKPRLAVQAQEVGANLSIWGFIFGNRVLDAAIVSQAKIELQTLPKEREEKKGFDFAVAWGDKGIDAVNISRSPLLKSSIFIVKNLELNNVNIHVDDRSAHTPTQYDIQIDRLHAQPIRSHFAIFDLLFRSNLDGTLNGSRLEIVNTTVNNERHTRWGTNDIPATTLASLVGGPFHLFENGTVDVEVTDLRKTDSVDNLDLNWKIRVSDAQARLPESTPKILNPLVQVWVDNINENQKDWEFGFQLQFAESQFKGASSLNAQQIWQDSIPIFLKQVAGNIGVEESTIKEKTESAFNSVKDYLKNRKKDD